MVPVETLSQQFGIFEPRQVTLRSESDVVRCHVTWPEVESVRGHLKPVLDSRAPANVLTCLDLLPRTCHQETDKENISVCLIILNHLRKR